MKKMNKRFSVIVLAAVTLLTTASVGAASVYRNVTAQQNTAMKVQVNGTSVSLKDDDDTNYPLILDDDVYLPAEEMADALGYDVTVKDNTLSMTTKKTASSSTTTTGDIGAEKAKEIALQHAGLTASQVSFIKAERDYDDGRLVYDVEFFTSNKEYDYEIAAADGTIRSYDYDAEGSYTPATTTSANYISSDKAKEIALQHAGLTASQVSFIKAERDYDDGRLVYDVEFFTSNKEYDYEIAAADGTIRSYDYDAEGSYTPATTTSANYISSDKAKEIALADAGLTSSQVYFSKVEFDYDDGRAEYEVEFRNGFTEYEYTIDAVSGSILKSERDH